MLQEYPVPVQAVLQQIPDTQLPLVHALFPLHASPFGFLATHAPPEQ